MKSFLKFATRPDNLVLVICLCLFAAVVAHGENGPTPQVIVGSSGISDGSVTNAKLAEPISIANGGTGATTAAAGLAALGGASLNGSSTVDFRAKDLIYGGAVTQRNFVANVGVAPGSSGDLFTTTGCLSATIQVNVNNSEAANALLWFTGNTIYTTHNPMDTICSVTKDTVGKINIYVESGKVVVQNNWTNTIGVYAVVGAVEGM